MDSVKIFKKFLKKNEEEAAQPQEIAAPQKPQLGSHYIFSTENSIGPNSINLSHDQILDMLKQKGYKVQSIHGVYGGKPERSIIVHSPPEENIPHLHDLSHKLGQEASIHSDGENHKMHFHHGDAAGKHVKGSGTEYFDAPPEDAFSDLEGLLFRHNFDWNKVHD